MPLERIAYRNYGEDDENGIGGCVAKLGDIPADDIVLFAPVYTSRDWAPEIIAFRCLGVWNGKVPCHEAQRRTKPKMTAAVSALPSRSAS